MGEEMRSLFESIFSNKKVLTDSINITRATFWKGFDETLKEFEEDYNSLTFKWEPKDHQNILFQLFKSNCYLLIYDGNYGNIYVYVDNRQEDFPKVEFTIRHDKDDGIKDSREKLLEVIKAIRKHPDILSEHKYNPDGSTQSYFWGEFRNKYMKK